MKLIIFILVLIELVLFRYQYVYGIEKNIVYILGVSALQTSMVAIFLYVSSVWLSCLCFLKWKIINMLIFSLIALLPFFLVNIYELSNYFNDALLIILLLIYSFSFMLFGSSIFNKFVKYVNLNDDEINNAFLEYPPEKYFDFIFYVVFVLIISIIPSVVKTIWT